MSATVSRPRPSRRAPDTHPSPPTPTSNPWRGATAGVAVVTAARKQLNESVAQVEALEDEVDHGTRTEMQGLARFGRGLTDRKL